VDIVRSSENSSYQSCKVGSIDKHIAKPLLIPIDYGLVVGLDFCVIASV
jgi:hypothetical protein